MNIFPEIDLEPLSEPIGAQRALTEQLSRTLPRPLVDAQTDSEIARAFLHHSELASSTLKSTKTELARFLLWCLTLKKTLSDLTVEDLSAYKKFLQDPQPAADWISTTRWPRNDPRWRPFAAPLSSQSARQAFRVSKALMTFATNAGYLTRNPGSLVKNIKAPAEARVSRYLDPLTIDYVYEAIDTLPATTPGSIKAKMRDRYLLVAYLTTGARLSELIAAKMGAVFCEGSPTSESRWWLEVQGKGLKPRRLPVPPEMLAAFRAYRTAFGLPPVALRNEDIPMVLNARGRGLVSITDEAAANAIKGLFTRAAVIAEVRKDADSALTLRHASTHWLRHTMLTTHANNGVSLKTLQDTAGHASLTTTSKYLHTTETKRHSEIIDSFENDKP